MSSRPPSAGKLPLTELAELKQRGEPIVMVTAYDYPSGRLVDAAGVDLVLVGDTAAMVVMGYDGTVPATLEEMLLLTRWVSRGASRPLVVGDLPFGSYEVSDGQAVESAVRMLKEGGADLVKLEGAGPSLSRLQSISAAGIPVLGHLGLTPQSATKLGGFKAQGRTATRAHELYDDALAVEAAGASALVLEAVPEPVAARITKALGIPTIGIGAGRECDGQVLVWHDLLGLYEGRSPRFAKRYAEIAPQIRAALERFVGDVRSRAFPGEEHTYSITREELARFEAELASVDS